jgi:uncharacterized protein
MGLSLEQGTVVVRLAREAVDAVVTKGVPASAPHSEGFLSERRGVFVTLNLAGAAQERLRGCVGFPLPVKPLGEATWEAAMLAAVDDPRFEPVKSEELSGIVLEVSVLTQPENISSGPRKDLPSKVRIGTDGLIVSTAHASGLLLPQVATEFGFQADDFLAQTCLKAGLPPDAWLDEQTDVRSFQAEIFAEETPRGRVSRHST